MLRVEDYVTSRAQVEDTLRSFQEMISLVFFSFLFLSYFQFIFYNFFLSAFTIGFVIIVIISFAFFLLILYVSSGCLFLSDFNLDCLRYARMGKKERGNGRESGRRRREEKEKMRNRIPSLYLYLEFLIAFFLRRLGTFSNFDFSGFFTFFCTLLSRLSPFCLLSCSLLPRQYTSLFLATSAFLCRRRTEGEGRKGRKGSFPLNPLS